MARHRVELEARAISRDLRLVDREKVETDRAIPFGGDGNKITPEPRIETTVNVLEIRCLPASRRTTIHDLELHFAAVVSDQGHVVGFREWG